MPLSRRQKPVTLPEVWLPASASASSPCAVAAEG